MYLTGNPIGPYGSNDPRDLSDTAQIADVIVNDTERESVNSRLGVPIRTVAGINADFDQWLAGQQFETVHLVYVPGQQLVVQRPTQLIDYNGSVYRVNTPANFPVTLSGAWANDAMRLTDVGDASLRQQLSGEEGSSMVGDPAGPLREAIRKVIFGGGISEILEWGSGSLTQRSQILLAEGSYYFYLGSILPKSISGVFSSEAPNTWLRLSGEIYKISPDMTPKRDLSGLIRSGIKVVITGDSLSFNAYGMGSGPLTPAGYAYNNPYGLMSWGHMLRDSLISSVPAFTLAKNAQIEFTAGVSRYPNVNSTYVAPFNNQLETFLVNSSDDEIYIRMNGVFSGGSCRLMFFTGNDSFTNIASFDIYTNGVLRRSIDLRGGSSPYLGRYQLNVDGVPLAGSSEVVLKNIKRADGAAGQAALQFIGYSTPGPDVYMTGHGGWTSGQVLADFENMVGQYSPDFIFYQIGANDMAESLNVSTAQFKSNVESFINNARALKPFCEIILLTTTPTGYSNLNSRYGRPGWYMDVLHEIAVKYRCGLVDVWGIFEKMNPAVWRIDSIHTTPTGGNIVYSNIMKLFFDNLKLAAGYVPDATYQVIPTVVSPAMKTRQAQISFDASGNPVVTSANNLLFSVSVSTAGLITITPTSNYRMISANFIASLPSSLLQAAITSINNTTGVTVVNPVNMLSSPPSSITSKSQLAGRSLTVGLA